MSRVYLGEMIISDNIGSCGIAQVVIEDIALGRVFGILSDISLIGDFWWYLFDVFFVETASVAVDPVMLKTRLTMVICRSILI